jgi:enamine deaminase RidA (YjgF/YER057c/UK114 family)
MSTIEDKLSTLGLELPSQGPPVGNFVSAVRTGNLMFVSGHGPYKDGQYIYRGKLGEDVDTATGYEAARLVMLNCLAGLKAEIGDLDRVARVVRVFGMVNSTPDFAEQPQVIDGASDLLTEILGDRGKHARAAVGMVALPMGISVEIEMVVEVA